MAELIFVENIGMKCIFNEAHLDKTMVGTHPQLPSVCNKSSCIWLCYSVMTQGFLFFL